MKFYIYQLLLIAFSFLVFSCTKPSTQDLIVSPNLSIDKNNITIGGLVNAKDSFTIQSNLNWVIAVSPTNTTWFTVNTKNGQNNNKIIIAGIENNNTGAARNATLTISPVGNTSIQPLILNLTQRTASLKDSADLILGKWKYVKDSSTNIGGYYFMENGTAYSPNPGVYYGTSADYWDFQNNGMSYMHANNQNASSAYILLADNRFEITESLVHGITYIVTLTPTEFIFYFSNMSPNGGVYHRRVFLKK